MLLNDFLKMTNRPISVMTGQGIHENVANSQPAVNENGETFADVLAKSKVEFSGHAMRRIESRSIDIQATKLDRLNRGVELAAQKGSSDALVLVDSMAFVVSVKNNKVITTMDTTALVGNGNIFTNIDSTIII
ncbi:MAG: hypothetical protein FWG33_00055 [Oscillospiraceae bacterium]|nr:hypothetical protein [Oscillospiraceae bacterium]